MAKKRAAKEVSQPVAGGYDGLLTGLVGLLESSRSAAARAVNSVMTATYWEVGRRIVEVEQGGEDRAAYGEEVVSRLAGDLTDRFGRGFSRSNLYQMRVFHETYSGIVQTPSGQSDSTAIVQTASAQSDLDRLQTLAARFPLPWSHYVRLLSVEDAAAREFYETEALRGGWSVRQLKRQIDTQFYERTLLSKDKAKMLRGGQSPTAADAVTAGEEIKDPLVLEFLGLKDEYSESDLEDGLIAKLEEFLLELGGDFAFVGRQRRLRIGDEWFRVDLLFFHRRLRCLVVVDLKVGAFSHADAGQMHMYLNYAAEHWTHEDENPPVGLILCASKDEAVARYALDGLPNQVMAGRYRLALPGEDLLAAELERTRRAIEGRAVAE